MPAEDMQVLTGAVNFTFNKTGFLLLFSLSAKIKNKSFGISRKVIQPQSGFADLKTAGTLLMAKFHCAGCHVPCRMNIISVHL
jgi:hypothetical protein